MSKKIQLMIVATLLPLVVSGCLSQVNRDLENMNRQMTASRTQAQREPEGSGVKTELVVPTDSRTKQAMEAALPKIQEVLSIHRCIKTDDGVRMLNYHTIPGVRIFEGWGWYPIGHMRYHSKNKCVGVRAIDQWSMPALNVLQFRVAYFAEDSGEAVNFQFQFKLSDNGRWLLSNLVSIR